jgi:hypothetical protein
MPEKLRLKILARNNRYGRKIPAFWSFYIPLPEKVTPENPSK